MGVCARAPISSPKSCTVCMLHKGCPNVDFFSCHATFVHYYLHADKKTVSQHPFSNSRFVFVFFKLLLASFGHKKDRISDTLWPLFDIGCQGITNGGSSASSGEKKKKKKTSSIHTLPNEIAPTPLSHNNQVRACPNIQIFL